MHACIHSLVHSFPFIFGLVSIRSYLGTYYCNLARVDGIGRVMANLCGELYVIGPHNGSNKRLQPSPVTAEESLVVALVFIVLL